MAHHALFIGINHYADKSIGELKFARKDAVELYTLFKGALGYGERAHLLEEPSASAVDDALERLGEQARTNDTFILYFAGHGEQHAGDQYLLLPNARLARLQSGHVAGNDLLSVASLSDSVASWRGAVQSLFILDACRSKPGKAGARSVGGLEAEVEAVLAGLAARDMRRRRLQPAAPDAAPGNPGTTILNACADGGQAYEVEDLGRGVFSLALQQHAELAVARSQPLLVVRNEVQALADTMQGLLPPAWRDRPQRPWLSQDPEPVLLWRPPRQAAPLPPAPPATFSATTPARAADSPDGGLRAPVERRAPELADERLLRRYSGLDAPCRPGQFRPGPLRRRTRLSNGCIEARIAATCATARATCPAACAATCAATCFTGRAASPVRRLGDGFAKGVGLEARAGRPRRFIATGEVSACRGAIEERGIGIRSAEGGKSRDIPEIIKA